MDKWNKNRGFCNLIVWQDAIELYSRTCKILAKQPFELKKTMGNCIDAANSMSRNIAEGYGRRSTKEYLVFLNYSMGSSSEYFSCIYSFFKADQLNKTDYDELNSLHYKVENGLINLIKSLELKLRGKK